MNKGYSKYIRPLTVIIDLIILNLLFYFLIVQPGYITGKDLVIDYTKYPRFYIAINIGWLMIAYIVKLYNVYRFSRLAKILRNLSNQVLIFFLLFSSLYAWSYLLLDKIAILIFIAVLSFTLLIFRLALFFGLRNYRSYGKNYRRVVIVGYDENSIQLYNFFRKKTEYGYKVRGFFSNTNTDNSSLIRGKVNEAKEYVLNNRIDEIYCSVNALTSDEIKDLINFADNNLKVIKFIPDSKGIYDGRELKVQYYDIQPIIVLRENPFDDPVNKWIKRIFDIIFSSFVIIFVLSWLVPILGFLIKRESKGPIFFKQKRSGLDNQEFEVYKFRSMGVNRNADKQQATKNDPRITKIGAFLRKSSIDELPQFINVFKGEMSVVGPRPHMISHTDFYSKKIDKFMVRHTVKPGITGLAQVLGFRGETETVSKMRARARMDRFYIENWSIFLDIRIILLTIYNAIKGEKEAY